MTLKIIHENTFLSYAYVSVFKEATSLREHKQGKPTAIQCVVTYV